MIAISNLGIAAAVLLPLLQGQEPSTEKYIVATVGSCNEDMCGFSAVLEGSDKVVYSEVYGVITEGQPIYLNCTRYTCTWNKYND